MITNAILIIGFIVVIILLIQIKSELIELNEYMEEEPEDYDYD